MDCFPSVLVKNIYVSLYQQQVEALVAYVQASKFLPNPLVKDFAQALVTNQLGPLCARPGASGVQCVLLELTVHLAAVLFCGNQEILAPLQQLATAPANMQVCVMSGAFCCWQLDLLFFEVN